jgi:hypothetical protein
VIIDIEKQSSDRPIAKKIMKISGLTNWKVYLKFAF